MGRLKDAYLALMGRSWWESELALMRTQWAHLMLEVADTMELLGRQIGRITVAQRRDRKKQDTVAGQSAPAAPSSPIGNNRWAQKAALRRARIGGAGTVAPPPATNLEEEIEEVK